jgi:iron complex transport system ATP-binding protein
MLDFQHLTVLRGDRPGLSDFSLRIGEGEHVAVLGPNGAGKSTLVKTITRELYPLHHPESVARLFGQEQWNVQALRARLGIVSPDLLKQVSGPFTARDIVLSGFFSSIGLWGPQIAEIESSPDWPMMIAKADAAMAKLRISALSSRPVATLSSGEATRVLIARALVHDPGTLLLDEPANSLDLFAQAELRHDMRTLAQQGIGLLLVTHHLADIIPEITRVVLLQDGRVVGDGTKEELLTAERLSALFGVSVAVTFRDGFYHAW